MPDYRPFNPMYDRAVKRMGTLEDHKYYKNIMVPSAQNQYSIAIEFMRDWFLSKFPKNYFKSVHIDGKHIAEDFINKNAIDRTKLLKPLVAITPKINLEFNRDNIDLMKHGKFVINDAFFKDLKRRTYLKAIPEQLEMPFEFRIKVSTKAAQIDLYKRMQLLFPVLESETPYMDIDIHIPYELVKAVGTDAGFKLNENGILEDIEGFVNYMNHHSDYVFLCKFRGITNRKEVFMRWPNINAHIKIDSALSADDGEREGALYNNFIIEMGVMLHFPAIKYFEYYCSQKHDYIVNEDDASEYFGMFSVSMLKIPEVNEKGWMQYVVTNYDDTDAVDDYLEIDFKELFAQSDIGTIIQYTKSLFVNPEVFMDIHLYNHEEEVFYKMDWNTLKLKTLSKVTAYKSYIVIYADYKYINDAVTILREVKDDRYRLT